MASPQNRAHWGLKDDIECAVCGKEEASVAHILAGCQKALQSGGYTFRHNAVLRVIAHEMQVMLNQVKKEVRKVCKDCKLLLSKKVSSAKGRQRNIISQEFYMKQKIG